LKQINNHVLAYAAKGLSGGVSVVLGLIGKPSETFVLLVGNFATKLKHLIDSATVTLDRFYVENAEALALLAWRQMSFRVHRHALQYAEASALATAYASLTRHGSWKP